MEQNEQKPMKQEIYSGTGDARTSTGIYYESRLVNVNDFTIIKVIGRGSFGKVYLVRKNDSEAFYAMKVLKKETVLKRNQKKNTKGKNCFNLQRSDISWRSSIILSW